MKRFTGLLAAAVAVLAAGCGSMSIVKKPEVEPVKTVVVVSVFANHGVYNVGGQAGQGGLTAGLSQLGSLAQSLGMKTDGVPGIDFGGTRLVDHGLRVFEDELGKVRGWTVLPSAKVIGTDAYKEFAATPQKETAAYGAIVSKLAAAGEGVAASGMRAFQIGHMDGQTNKAKQLGALARKLGVDAVAVVQFDIGYSAYNAVNGTGTATASVGTSLKIVNPDGKFVVVTFDAEKNGGRRFRSSTTTALVGGNITYSDEAERMFQAAIQQSAMAMREEINKGL